MGPYGLLVGLFVVTAVFGQLISNTATALIVIPIGAAAATEMGVDVRPVMMSICVAAAAALLTPVATPVNLIAHGRGGLPVRGLLAARRGGHGRLLRRLGRRRPDLLAVHLTFGVQRQ